MAHAKVESREPTHILASAVRTRNHSGTIEQDVHSQALTLCKQSVREAVARLVNSSAMNCR